MKLSDLGEFGLINRLQRMVEARNLRPSEQAGVVFPLRVGIGDDAAAWETARAIELGKTDTMVEGVHFTRRTATWRDVGWKAMVANQSDVASMGGVPFYVLVTLGLPLEMEVKDVEELYVGLLDACAEHGGVVVGGDVVRSPVFFITISLTGVTRGRLLLRSAARPGDQVAVTGTLGGAEGGLQLLLKGLELPSASDRALREAHLHRHPRVPEGRVLASNGVRCAMDISDGLVDDLGKLCQASGVAARIFAQRLPTHPALRTAFPAGATSLALMSGEEYELLFTAPAHVMTKVCPLLPAGGTVIGDIHAGEPGRVEVVDAQGHRLEIPKGGWDHFRP